MFEIDKIFINKNIRAPFAVLMRHAEKELESTPTTYDCQLTDEGRQNTHELALRLKELMGVEQIMTSPVPRCVVTADILAAGLEVTSVQQSTLLGHPGAYIQDGSLAGVAFENDSVYGVVEKQLAGKDLPGFRNINVAQRLIVNQLVDDFRSGFQTLYVSHDVILSCLLGGLFGLPMGQDCWVNYLQGCVVEYQGNKQMTFHLLDREVMINAS